MYQPKYNLESSVNTYASSNQNFNSYGSFNNFREDNVLNFLNYRDISNYNGDFVYSYNDRYNRRTNRAIGVIYSNDLSFFVKSLSDIEFKDAEIENVAKEVFVFVTGKEIDDSIKINICPIDEFRELQIKFGVIGDNVQGFCINGEKLIFVKKMDIGGTLVVLGHELGHIFTNELKNKHDEEAKAFAFCIEWVKKIKEKNILNLQESLNSDLRPAINGLHNVAFNFILENLSKGRTAMELYWELVYGIISLYN